MPPYWKGISAFHASRCCPLQRRQYYAAPNRSRQFSCPSWRHRLRSIDWLSHDPRSETFRFVFYLSWTAGGCVLYVQMMRFFMAVLQGNQSDCGHFTRLDPRRQTISSPADLLRNRIPYDQVNPTTSVLTSTLLKPDRRVSRPKNPDSYIQDTSDLYQRERYVRRTLSLLR